MDGMIGMLEQFEAAGELQLDPNIRTLMDAFGKHEKDRALEVDILDCLAKKTPPETKRSLPPTEEPRHLSVEPMPIAEQAFLPEDRSASGIFRYFHRDVSQIGVGTSPPRPLLMRAHRPCLPVEDIVGRIHTKQAAFEEADTWCDRLGLSPSERPHTHPSQEDLIESVRLERIDEAKRAGIPLGSPTRKRQRVTATDDERAVRLMTVRELRQRAVKLGIDCTHPTGAMKLKNVLRGEIIECMRKYPR